MAPRVCRVAAVLGGVLLLASLPLVWSHQLPAALRAAYPPGTFAGVPEAPDAFQVYAIADVVLLLLGVGIVVAGLWGRRRTRAGTWVVGALGLAFVLHASADPPTNGVLVATGVGQAARYVHDPATAGGGETLAGIGLIVALAALAASLAPWPGELAAAPDTVSS